MSRRLSHPTLVGYLVLVALGSIAFSMVSSSQNEELLLVLQRLDVVEGRLTTLSLAVLEGDEETARQLAEAFTAEPGAPSTPTVRSEPREASRPAQQNPPPPAPAGPTPAPSQPAETSQPSPEPAEPSQTEPEPKPEPQPEPSPDGPVNEVVDEVQKTLDDLLP